MKCVSWMNASSAHYPTRKAGGQSTPSLAEAWIHLQQDPLGRKCACYLESRTVLQKFPLVREWGEMYEGESLKLCSSWLVLVLVSSCFCTSITEYVSLNIEGMTCTVRSDWFMWRPLLCPTLGWLSWWPWPKSFKKRNYCSHPSPLRSLLRFEGNASVICYPVIESSELLTLEEIQDLLCFVHKPILRRACCFLMLLGSCSPALI